MPFGSYESVGRGFESLPSHQEKPEHVYVLVFLGAMEGARTGRRRIAPQAISPVGCCLARRFQCVGMSTVEAVKSKDFMAFLFFRQSLHTFAHLLHTLQKNHELFASLAQRVFRCTKRNFYAKSTRVSSRRSSASICRTASRIILPVIFVATGVLFSGGSCGFAPATSCV